MLKMFTSLASTKFLLALSVVISVTIMAYVGKVSGEVYSAIINSIGGLYLGFRFASDTVMKNGNGKPTPPTNSEGNGTV